MNGQDPMTMKDPLFAKMETWQKENPVRRRITSADICKEQGNFITYAGQFRRKRVSNRKAPSDGVDEFQLADDKGVLFIRPTKFISRDDIKKVHFTLIYLN